ncbi:hypothetical protein BDW62DRAFT_200118 [Aspergillus aurantiobrunneus]
MVKPRERFLSEGHGYFGDSENPTTEAECNVWDWDRLRMIKIKGTAKVFPPDEDLEVPILAKLADHLSPKVCAITVDNNGLLTGVSTDPEEDDTLFLAYLPFLMCPLLADCRTVNYTQLQELDRLGPGVDLASYDEAGMAWEELNLLKSLPPHPNILPFDRVVLDDGDVEPRLLGFTTKYVPGGTLDNPQGPFKFKWLQQLTQVVDYLNLELGVMHQDVAPRSLLINPETNNILLFDFDRAAVGRKGLLTGREDITGVVFILCSFM